MAPRKITNRDQLAASVARIGVILQRRANREKTLKARIASNSAKVDRDKERLSSASRKDEALIRDIAVGVFAFATTHKDELLPEDRRTAPVDTGKLRWYDGAGKLEYATDEDATVAELLELLRAGSISQAEFDKVVETKYKVKKTNLRDETPLLDRLQTASVRAGHFFAIEPGNTSEKFSDALGALNEGASEAGLLPTGTESDPES
jgi:phage host-nuclease inhibitor protein Gam